MTAQPYTADQILAAFSKGLKGTRMKAMAQEIAGLANENAALKHQIAQLQHVPTVDEIEMVNGEAAKILAQARDEAENLRSEAKQEAATVLDDALAKASETTSEAEKMLSDAHANVFTAASRAWEEGHENWQKAHSSAEFIPSPISTAALELVEVLHAVGDFSPGERRLKLAPGGYGATLSVGKTKVRDSFAEVLGTPEKGETITGKVEVQLFAERAPEWISEGREKYIFAYAQGHLLGGITATTSAYLSPFSEAMEALGISVFIDAELTLTASEAKGALQQKSAVDLPEKFVVRDTMPKIRRIAKILNSIYVQNTLMTPENVEWFKKFGRLSTEMRQSMNRTRDYEREMSVMSWYARK